MYMIADGKRLEMYWNAWMREWFLRNNRVKVFEIGFVKIVLCIYAYGS
jgi:hypothetical protein